jgi:bacillithiol synthase
MNLHQIEFEETGRFSSIFLDYVKNKASLRPFFNQYPDADNFKILIEQRNFDNAKRDGLVNDLQNQYRGLKIETAVRKNIALLADNSTYTITTGHQLNILTGPMFFIYKIIGAINLSKRLKEKYPSNNFVPVYWMASEDHDFDEISSFRLFGKEYKWESEAKGPVGKLKTESLKLLLEVIPDLPGFILDCYLDSDNLAEATRVLVNELFGDEGLLIIDADQKSLKSQFRPVIKDDILQHTANQLTEKSTRTLENLGYSGQIFPREINFFYMENELRERIVLEDDKYKVMNTSLVFSEAEMQKLIETSPEKFSPNVVLRPLYQETILPNIAYVGGPAELAYWLQLKPVFEHYEVPFPMLIPRLFAMIIPGAIMKKMDKNQLQIHDLFSDLETLKTRIINAGEEGSCDLREELDKLQNLFDAIREKAARSDKSLEGFVMSEYKKAEKSVDHIQKRIKKAEEQKHEISINQVKGILEKLFPNGSLQEREDNFLNFFINDPGFIAKLKGTLDPLVFKFNVFTENA